VTDNIKSRPLTFQERLVQIPVGVHFFLLFSLEIIRAMYLGLHKTFQNFTSIRKEGLLSLLLSLESTKIKNNETEISISVPANPWKALLPENSPSTNAGLIAENCNQVTEFSDYKVKPFQRIRGNNWSLRLTSDSLSNSQKTEVFLIVYGDGTLKSIGCSNSFTWPRV
jgi:hypothetical protein